MDLNQLTRVEMRYGMRSSAYNTSALEEPCSLERMIYETKLISKDKRKSIWQASD